MSTTTKKPASKAATATSLTGNRCNLHTVSSLGRDVVTTIGRSIFQDGIYGGRILRDVRNQLEMKYAACLSTGGNNGFPLDISQIENPLFRQIAAAAVSSKEWTIQDLAGYHERLAIPAEVVLIATLEKPVWGEDDQQVFRLLRTLQSYERKSQQGGRTL